MSAPRQHPIFRILGCLSLCYGVGFVGDQGAIRGLGAWYLFMSKPAWSPPDWLFTPIWTVAYGLLGLSLYFAIQGERRTKGAAIAVFLIQLVLSGAWPWLFFSGHLLLISSVEILALWMTVAFSTALFATLTRPGAIFLGLYLLWVSYLAGVCITVWRMSLAPDNVQVVGFHRNPAKNKAVVTLLLKAQDSSAPPFQNQRQTKCPKRICSPLSRRGQAII